MSQSCSVHDGSERGVYRDRRINRRLHHHVAARSCGSNAARTVQRNRAAQSNKRNVPKPVKRFVLAVPVTVSTKMQRPVPSILTGYRNRLRGIRSDGECWNLRARKRKLLLPDAPLWSLPRTHEPESRLQLPAWSAVFTRLAE